MQAPTDDLRQLFGGTQDEAFKNGMKVLLSSDQLRGLREASGRMRTLQWPGATAEIMSGMDDLLKTSLSGILVKTWNEAGILKRYVNKKEYDPEAVVLVDLAEHTVRSKHQPYLEVSVDNLIKHKIQLGIELELTVEGIVLKIQDARIKEIRTGTCKGSGKINFEGLLLAEKKSKPIQLPGRISFEKGIPIAP